MNVHRRLDALGVATTAHALAETLRNLGVRRLFGVPGGGSSLDLIAAARAHGLPFILARHETAAVMMAAVTGELSGVPGVALVTRGPGVSNAVNGLAYASLDRAATILVTDGFDERQNIYATHQLLDQATILGPVAKAYERVEGPGIRALTRQLAAHALAPPIGPVVIELTGAAAAEPALVEYCFEPPEAVCADPDSIAHARALLARAKRPILVLGLETRDRESCAAARALAEALACPVLVTYKAKGVLPDAHPLYAGIFTGGIAEAPIMARADLVLLVGADPVEFIPQPWRYKVPVIDFALFARPVHYVSPAASVVGPIAAPLLALTETAAASSWDLGMIARHCETVHEQLGYPGRRNEVGPQRVVEMAHAACRTHGVDARVTVDAGAHMISATTFWPCLRPNDLLISNGLASMGFAVPAAIAAALHEPTRPVIAFTGDGGLAMCLGELATAVSIGARIIVIVFNDGGLSLISAKRGQHDLGPNSLNWKHADFATVMTGLGGLGISVASVNGYAAALDAALVADGPVLIDVRIDPGGYPRQLQALRG